MLNTWPKFIILLSGIYHLVAGIFVLGPKSWTIYFSKNTYSLNIPNDYEPRYEISLHFLGLMGIALSLHLFIVLFFGDNTIQKYSLFILGVLFIARSILRIIYKQMIFDAYKLDFKRSLINISFNIFIGILSIISIYYL